MTPLRTVGLVAAGLVVVAGAVLVSGAVPLPFGGGSDLPPCAELPSEQAAQAALAAHPELVDELTAVGPSVDVAVITPCEDPADRGAIAITYDTSAERDKIDAIITSQDGFGIPLRVQSR